MTGGKVLITGGSGFLGVSVAQKLLARDQSTKIVLTDIAHHPRTEALAGPTEFVQADLSDAAACRRLVTKDIATVYHFASLVSGGAEQDFVAGMKANVFATLNLLEACREAGACPRFVFTSSIATFGGARAPGIIDDYTHQHPQNSYGVAKVVGEQLLNDYTRKGFIDGRGVRLAAIVVRDVANTALSGYASAIVREPVAGRDYVCPVPPDARLPILDVRRCVDLLVGLGDIEGSALGDYRTVNSHSIAPSAEEIAEAVRASGVKGLGKISFGPEPAVASVVATWPRGLRSERADAIFGPARGLTIENIVAEYARSVGKLPGVNS